MPASLASSGASRSAHAEDVHRDGDQAPLTAGPVVKKGKWKRFVESIRSAGSATKLWASTVGTLVVTVYQMLYFWHRAYTEFMPVGAKAWVLGFVMIGIYVATKLFHLLGQEPGDAEGNVREVYFILINYTIAVVFLVHAYYAPHAQNAVGISVVLIICFNCVLIAQLIQSIVLARRTWTDSSAGPTS